MTARERVNRTLDHQPVDRAPRELWTTPHTWMFRKAELDRLRAAFEWDFDGPKFKYGPAVRAKGVEGALGSYTDAWGAIWEVAEAGVVGEIKHPILADGSALDSYQPPWELLDGADLSRVNRSCAESSRFMRPGTQVRPFERVQFLRGTENALMDLAYDAPEMRRLLGMLHDFGCREMEMWARTDVDGVTFMDDWGSQTALLISPDMWRAIFKPLYRDYCRILRARKKRVFFHSDGFIEEIYPDLIEIGVDAVNSQLFCMDIEKLGRLYNGRITFWGEIDRQRTLPFGTEADARAAVRRLRRALDQGQGGLIAECSWERGTPYENVFAVYDEWSRPREA
jgi:hypothetical protein